MHSYQLASASCVYLSPMQTRSLSAPLVQLFDLEGALQQHFSVFYTHTLTRSNRENKPLAAVLTAQLISGFAEMSSPVQLMFWFLAKDSYTNQGKQGGHLKVIPR